VSNHLITVVWTGHHIYISAKSNIGCFTLGVVTLVADKLRRQWLWVSIWD